MTIMYMENDCQCAVVNITTLEGTNVPQNSKFVKRNKQILIGEFNGKSDHYRIIVNSRVCFPPPLPFTSHTKDQFIKAGFELSSFVAD